MKSALRLTVLCALALTACQKPADHKQAEARPSKASNGPDAKPGLSLRDGRLILPAVTGNPGAAYFVLDNTGTSVVELKAISIDGVATAEMHQTAGDTMVPIDHAEVAPRTNLTFEPGNLHVMLSGIDARLKPGGTTEMTLSFADGDKLSTPLKIEAMGADGHGEGGMH